MLSESNAGGFGTLGRVILAEKEVKIMHDRHEGRWGPADEMTANPFRRMNSKIKLGRRQWQTTTTVKKII